MTKRVVIFDAGEELYVLQEMLTPDGGAPNLFSVLTSGTRIRKSEIKTPAHFYQCLIEYQSNKSSHEIGKRR